MRIMAYMFSFPDNFNCMFFVCLVVFSVFDRVSCSQVGLDKLSAEPLNWGAEVEIFFFLILFLFFNPGSSCSEIHNHPTSASSFSLPLSQGDVELCQRWFKIICVSAWCGRGWGTCARVYMWGSACNLVEFELSIYHYVGFRDQVQVIQLWLARGRKIERKPIQLFED